MNIKRWFCFSVSIIALLFCSKSNTYALASQEEYASETSLAWSPDESKLAIGYSSGRIEVIDVPTNGKKAIGTLKAQITSLAWNSGGTRLAAAVSTGGIHVYDVSTGGKILKLDPPADNTSSVAWSPDDQLIASANNRVAGATENPSNIMIWNATTGQLLFTFKLEGKAVRVVNITTGETVQYYANAIIPSQIDWGSNGHLVYNDENSYYIVSPATDITATLTPTPSPTATIVVPSPTPYPFPATNTLDNFNRNDGSVGDNWRGTQNTFGIDANHLKIIDQEGWLLWSPSLFSANQEAYVTLTNVEGTSGAISLLLKVQGNDLSVGYLELDYEPTENCVSLWSHVGKGMTLEGNNIPVTFFNGDRFGVRAFEDGTVEVYRNGTAIGSFDVWDWAFTSSAGSIGLRSANSNGLVLDDFGGGNLVYAG
jgi:WD40 repeat protein